MAELRSERRFPSEAEVDAWLARHMVEQGRCDPYVDQLMAAADDTAGRFQASAPYLVAAGRAQWALLGGPLEDDDARVHHFRAAARACLAAESVGILPLCEHTGQIRPLVLHCDPPVAVCAECHGRADIQTAIRSIGHLWNHQCDRCGAIVDRIAAHMATLGHITVAGHVCARCAGDDRRHAVRVAERSVPVGPRLPCPCGSGRRFKNCCGRRRVVIT